MFYGENNVLSKALKFEELVAEEEDDRNENGK